MNNRQAIEFLNDHLNIELIPNTEEGGFFYPTYKSELKLPNNLFSDLDTPKSERSLGDAIYYLVTKHSPSRIHRVMGDIIYHFYTGEPVEILLIYPDGHKPQSEIILFGNNLAAGQVPMKSIPGGTWMGARINGDGDYALMGVTLSPGFDQADYQIADPEEFKRSHKQYTKFIDSLSPAQSFYIFDIDENMLSLPTKIILFPKNDKADPIEISQEDHDREKDNIGKNGQFKNYELISPDSYRYFNDITEEEEQNGQGEHFVIDIEKAVSDGSYKGPSWKVFSYAVENNRPLAIITARGHSEGIIKAGIRRLVELKVIPGMPNLLEVQCVNNSDMKKALEAKATEEERSKGRINSARRKRIAAREFVESCVKEYGEIPEHKFGMSDDNKDNVYSVIQAMADSKEKFGHMRFYVINTHQGDFVKLEVEHLIARS